MVAHNLVRITKDGMGAMFSEARTFSLRAAAFEMEIPPTTRWRILREKLKRFSYKILMHRRTNADKKNKRVDFDQYYRNELGNDSKFLR